MTMRCMLLAWLALVTLPVLAVVNPEEAHRPVPGWLARVAIGEDADSNLRVPFCAGALIGSRWVATASGCFNDPFRVLYSQRGLDHPRYYVKLGAEGDYLPVAQLYQSPDRGVILLELEQEVAITPLSIDRRPLATLYDEPVLILGEQSSAPLGHALYNPGGGPEAECVFADDAATGPPDARCYVYTMPVRHSVLVQARATLVDPAGPARPAGTFNDMQVPVTNGSRLYLAFEPGGGYTCMEDMGLPILSESADGELAMVGMINASGSAMGTPVCGPTLANWFSVAAHYGDWFTRVQAEAMLRHLCPPAPVTQVQYLEGDVVLQWQPVQGATGYRVFHSERGGFTPVAGTDVGALTQLVVPLSRAAGHEVAVQAYNESCTGPVSDPFTIRAAP